MKELEQVESILYSTEPTEKRIMALCSLAGKWFCALQARHFGEKGAPTITEKQRAIQRYVYSWDIFAAAKFYKDFNYGGKPTPEHTEDDIKLGVFVNSWNVFAGRQIPFELWSDIAEEGLTLLREMIQTGDFDYEKNPKYKEFMKRHYDRVEEISMMPEYSDKFQMGY